MKSFTTVAAMVLMAAQAWASASSFGVLEFDNVGFSGSYRDVASISNENTDQCTCQLSNTPTQFSGPIAPLNEEVSVHFRGPLVLHEFGYYTSAGSSANWTRQAHYDASAQTADNVTFLTKAGVNSSCLGVALTYAGSDGVSKANLATVLANGTKIVSGDEYAIFSNVSCGASGASNDCGVYRSGIPAFHGFYGAQKMFLFSFEMPDEDKVPFGDVFSWNMPAIWLLNAKIPRTSQYSTNGNCSCWASGCGEFDIFEVMNTTETGNLYSTIHDYQGTGQINEGLAIYGYIPRDINGVMHGGVVFDQLGKAQVFVSNSTAISPSLAASAVSGWISAAGAAKVDTLSSVAPQSSASSSKSKNGGAGGFGSESLWSTVALAAMSAVIYFI